MEGSGRIGPRTAWAELERRLRIMGRGASKDEDGR